MILPRKAQPPTAVGKDGLPVERTSATGIPGKQRAVTPDAMVDSVRFATWHITLAIQQSKDPDDIRFRAYYVRTASGNEAVMLAVKYWQKWEGPKDEHGQPIPGKFPDVACYPHEHVAMAIDENDFMRAWKAAWKVKEKGGRMEFAGVRARPMHFTFANSEDFDVINKQADPEVWGKTMKRRGRV